VSGRSLLDAAVSDPSSGAGAGVVNGCKLLDAAVSDTSSGVVAGVATGRKLRDASVSDSATTGTGAGVVSGAFYWPRQCLTPALALALAL